MPAHSAPIALRCVPHQGFSPLALESSFLALKGPQGYMAVVVVVVCRPVKPVQCGTVIGEPYNLPLT